MARNTRRTTHPYQHVPARRGIAGYVGVAADPRADPARVYPARQLVVPAVLDTPVTAGGEELDLGGSPGGGGVTVTDGVTTVTDASIIGLTGGTVSESPPGTAQMTVTSGEQVIRLLGPFAIAWNTPNLFTGAVLVALSADDLLLNLEIVPTVVWNGDTDEPPRAGLATPADATTWTDFEIALGITNNMSNVTPVDGYTTVQKQNSFRGMFVPPSHTNLVICLVSGNDTQGEADIYALIATPA
jgi:hypothetical protein